MLTSYKRTQGKTGFHMGALDPKDCTAEDCDAMASTVGRAASSYSTPMYKEMVVNCISQVCVVCLKNICVSHCCACMFDRSLGHWGCHTSIKHARKS